MYSIVDYVVSAQSCQRDAMQQIIASIKEEITESTTAGLG